MEDPGAHALSLQIEAEIEVEVRAYLARNPGAGDTATGIWQCWLTHAKDRSDAVFVERVLEDMALRQVIEVVISGNGQRMYFGMAGSAHDGAAGQ